MILNLNPRVVSFHYTLKNSKGEQLESSFGSDPLMFLEGVGQIIPGLEKELQMMKAGDKKVITVKATDAYGEIEADMIVEVPREKLPKKDVEVGDRFHADAGDGSAQVVMVTKVTETHVTIDGNHPLAGQDLTFEVEVDSTRDATKEELEHGHAHGAGGHNH
jgi:FKBP-type peptidyl-prolyl cis-trans isomerase SlyD